MNDLVPSSRSRSEAPGGAAPVACAAVLAVVAAGCGPSPLARSYDAYIVQVEPVLDQETERWNRLAELLRTRQDDLASPRYFSYLESTAIPFYTQMRETLVAVQPEGERIAAAHADVLRFAEARLAFVSVEATARDVFAAAAREGDVLDVFSGLQEAEDLRIEYQLAVGRDVPDAKLGELSQLVNSFRERYFDPLRQGARDPEEVRERLRSYVIPQLEELQRRKYGDDERGRLLKASVSAWLAWHRKLERACPTLQRVWRIKSESEAAARDAEEAFVAFSEKLEAIRRDR